MKRWLTLAPLAVLIGLGVLFAGYALRHDPKVIPDALVGQPTPDVSMPALEGGAPRPLKAQLGRPLLINVFASWCAPCAVENPQLLRLQAEGVPIIGIAYKDAPVDTARYLRRMGNAYDQVLVDRSGDVGVELGVSGVPETYLVDDSGKIVAKYGPLSGADADAVAARLKALR